MAKDKEAKEGYLGWWLDLPDKGYRTPRDFLHWQGIVRDANSHLQSVTALNDDFRAVIEYDQRVPDARTNALRSPDAQQDHTTILGLAGQFAEIAKQIERISKTTGKMDETATALRKAQHDLEAARQAAERAREDDERANTDSQSAEALRTRAANYEAELKLLEQELQAAQTLLSQTNGSMQQILSSEQKLGIDQTDRKQELTRQLRDCQTSIENIVARLTKKREQLDTARASAPNGETLTRLRERQSDKNSEYSKARDAVVRVEQTLHDAEGARTKAEQNQMQRGGDFSALRTRYTQCVTQARQSLTDIGFQDRWRHKEDGAEHTIQSSVQALSRTVNDDISDADENAATEVRATAEELRTIAKRMQKAMDAARKDPETQAERIIAGANGPEALDNFARRYLQIKQRLDNLLSASPLMVWNFWSDPRFIQDGEKTVRQQLKDMQSEINECIRHNEAGASSDEVIVKRLDTLSQKIDALEKSMAQQIERFRRNRSKDLTFDDLNRSRLNRRDRENLQLPVSWRIAALRNSIRNAVGITLFDNPVVRQKWIRNAGYIAALLAGSVVGYNAMNSGGSPAPSQPGAASSPQPGGQPSAQPSHTSSPISPPSNIEEPAQIDQTTWKEILKEAQKSAEEKGQK